MGAHIVQSDTALHLHLLKCEVNALKDCLLGILTHVEFQSKEFLSYKDDLINTSVVSQEKVNSLHEFFGLVSSEIHLANNKMLIIEGETQNLCQTAETETFSLNIKTDEENDSEEHTKCYKCSYCGKSYNNQCNLNRHKIMHTNNTLNCILCGKRFPNQNEYKNHYKRHSKETDKQCSACEKRFIASYQLKKHVKDEHKTLRSHDEKDLKYEQENNFDADDSVNIKSDVDNNDGSENGFLSPVQSLEEKVDLDNDYEFNSTYKDENVVRSNNGDRLDEIHSIDPIEIDASMKKRKRKHKKESSTTSENLFTCDMCGKKFRRVNALKRHVSKVHNKPEEKSDNSDTEENYDQNEETNDNGVCDNHMTTYTCSECGKSYLNQQNLNRHQKMHTKNTFDCSFCGKQFPNLSEYKSHTDRHNNETDKKCNFCDKQFLKIHKLKAHILSTHRELLPPDGEKSLLQTEKCPDCPKAFQNNCDLKNHMKVHSDEKAYMCDLCGNSYKSNAALKRHMFKHSGIRPFTCTICNKGFTTASHRKSHMYIHTGEKPYQCVTCGDRFTYDSNLRMHMRRHTGIKPFQCDQCPLRFYLRSQLKKHRRVHFNERPYKCKYCPASFKSSSNCVSHTRSHTGEKPYECTVCKKRFKDSNYLKEHMGIHTGISFPCFSCGKTYARKKGLAVHLKSNKETCYKIHHAFQKETPIMEDESANLYKMSLATANAYKSPSLETTSYKVQMPNTNTNSYKLPDAELNSFKFQEPEINCYKVPEKELSSFKLQEAETNSCKLQIPLSESNSYKLPVMENSYKLPLPEVYANIDAK